jgi:hypothetical protein
MIKNLAYLKTALEVLEAGQESEITQIKILRVMAQICQQNADRIQQDLENLIDQKMEEIAKETVDNRAV